MPYTYVSETAPQTYQGQAAGILTKYFDPTGAQCINESLLKCIAYNDTVRLGIQLILGITSKSNWKIKADEFSPYYEKFSKAQIDNIQSYLQQNLDKFRDILLNTGLKNQIIYGWQVFERILEWNADAQMTLVKDLKPILHEYTEILVNPNGDYAGIRNIPPYGKMAEIPKSELLLFNIDVVGQNWYGTSMLVSAADPFLELCKIQFLSTQLIERISKRSGYIKYPVGSTMINGEEVDNADIAEAVATNLSKAGYTTIPHEQRRDLTPETSDGWEIVHQEPTGVNAASIIKDRIDELKSRLINSLGLPSRALLDGKFGSYSSNETYRETAYDILATRLNGLIRSVNEQFIDPLLELNYDAPGLFYVSASPLDDDQIQNMFRLYSIIQQNPAVDIDEVNRQLGIPLKDTDGSEFAPAALSEPMITEPALEGYWLDCDYLAKKLGMQRSSVKNQLLRLKDKDPKIEWIYQGSDRQHRLNSNFVKQAFGININTEDLKND
jgi:hypothetical protein